MLKLLVSREGTNAKTLSDAVNALSGYDSLGLFLKQYKERYPERPLPPDPMPTSGVSKRFSAR